MGRAKEIESSASMREKLSYGSYLKVDELINLQKPLSEPQAHDEMLFIVIHQAYELWFKQILFELETLVTLLESDRLTPCFPIAQRINKIFKLLVGQVDILETMTPVDFNRFRSHLNPASGFQSLQFRELELLAGADASDYKKFFKLDPEWKEALSVRMQRTNLKQAFFQLLRHRQLVGERTKIAGIKKALLEVYQNQKYLAIRQFCECLIEFDELFSLWRFRHVQMVERMIGMKTGTGGSLGVKYLQGTLQKRFFPELWEIRTEMNGSYGNVPV